MRNILVEDIYALETVPDNSLLILIISSLIFLVVVYSVARRLIKNYNLKKYKEMRLALSVLKSCDFKHIKKSAYQISYYGKLLVTTKKQEELFEKILKDLEVHKYEENPQAFSLSFKALYETFIEDVESVHA